MRRAGLGLQYISLRGTCRQLQRAAEKPRFAGPGEDWKHEGPSRPSDVFGAL